MRKRLGFAAYARWCGLLKRQPMAAVELVESGECSRTAAYRFTSVMYCAGLLHIAEWRQVEGRQTLPRFRFGRGEDAPFPATRPNGRETHGGAKRIYPDHSPEVSRFAKAIAVLEDVSGAADLREHADIDQHTARKLLASLHECGVISVVAWERSNSTHWVPQYQVGGGKNVQKPKKESREVVNRRYWQRKSRLKQTTNILRLWAPMREAA